MFYTHRPLEWEAQVEEWFPGRLKRLKKRALGEVKKPVWAEVLKELRGMPWNMGA